MDDQNVLPNSPLQVNISSQILDIIFEYALNKFDDSEYRMAAGTAKFLSIIDQFVLAGKRVETCLPAFPFKSANKVYKVLGPLPDKAEELALERLNSMCARIEQIYKPGAKVTIISDGITYNDLLSISDCETWRYGEALRRMAADKKFNHLGFARMQDLLDFPLPDKLREITYVANCTNFRRLLLNKYGKPNMNIDQEIKSNPDTMLTYLGYRKFLESDLKYIFALGEDRGSNQYKRDVKYVAKEMLIRGYAFAGAIKDAFPNHLRLSIHESIGEHKVSFSLLNTNTGYTTPWHCSVAQLADGQWVSAPMGEFQKDPRLEVVYEEGRPSYFKEKFDITGNFSICKQTADYLHTHKRFDGRLSGHSSPSMTSADHEVPLEILEYHTQALPSSRDTVAGSSPQIMDRLADAKPNQVVFSSTKVSDNVLIPQPSSLDVS
ncbi:DIT1, Pyoverdine dityrosine biosynthesis protein [Pyrenophora tritici-repentis]|nr:Pyoverdine/dityrosine biosynthesis protein [Pyrenophora tritici-repentis]PZD23733.1 DIT1, Pyoverdine dityrosine biosynthesis protein [Pyrenophora tritici-repentis]PZD30782.1 DIT1, Pyoverdine dityrosine biosynthesis protein [Pyrenophora tritici-repentis]